MDDDAQISRVFLEELDALRWTEPDQALEKAAWSIDYVAREDLPLALGVAGSAARQLCRFEESEHALLAACEISAVQDAPTGALLQRLSTMEIARGNAEKGRGIAAQAIHAHAVRGDAIGTARAIVDEGIALFHLKQYVKAGRRFRVALESLPTNETSNRIAVWQYLGMLHSDEGRFSEAEGAFTTAENLAGDQPEALMRLRWARARLLSKTDRYSEASTLLRDVFRYFLSVNPGDATLAACDLVASLFRLGRTGEAHRTVDMLLPLVEPLNDYKKVSEALRTLLVARHAQLTIEVVEATRAAIDAARASPSEWPLNRSARSRDRTRP